MYPRYVLEVLLPPTNGRVISSRPLQPSNAEPPMIVTLDGISMLVRPLQPENAECPMLVTSSGTIPIPSITIPLSNFPLRTIGSTSPLHPYNAESPMIVTLDGISMLVRPLQL